MKVLVIGYDKKMFDANNVEHKRMAQCAAAVDSLDLIIFTRKEEGFTTTTFADNFTVHATNSINKPFMLLDAIRIGRRILKKKKQVSVITTQDPFESGLVGWLLSLMSSATLNVQEHGDVYSTDYWKEESLLNKLRYHFGLFILKRADVVRVVSERSRQTMRALLGQEKPITKLSVAVPIEDHLQHVVNTKAARVPFTFITAARFVTQKNLPLLLRAFKTVHDSVPDTRLVIVGQGLLQSALEKQAQELFPTTDEHPIRFVAWTDDLPALMEQADAYVLSSYYEGWGRVLIEAMVMQLPIVTTDVGCAGEVVKDGVHGFVTPVDNEAAFASAMYTLAADPAVYRRIKESLASIDPYSIPGTNLAGYGKAWRDTLTQ